MTPSRSRDQIIADAESINPILAYDLRGSAAATMRCATPIYTSWLNDKGESVPLELVEGKYGAGYVRVSTMGQRIDGWSTLDQIERIVDYYLRKGQAFRIFSDASLSGKLPTDSEELIQKMRNASALRYEEAYRSVMFSDGRFLEDRPMMEKWLEGAVQAIREGRAAHDANMVDAPIPLFKQGKGTDLHRRGKRMHGYRPGLTEMMRAIKSGMIHGIALTDVSRLSRSQSLFAQIAEDLQQYKVKVTGLVENLDWIKGTGGGGGLGDQITASILTIIAEYRLREVAVGVIRGLSQAVAQGRPLGMLPQWMDYNEKREAILIPERAKVIRDIVLLALGEYPGVTEMLNPTALATFLNDRPDQYPPPKGKGKKEAMSRGYWETGTIRNILKNPALCGYQDALGRMWRVLPPIISEDEWRRLQDRMRERQASPAVNGPKPKVHLMSRLLRCGCGRPMKAYTSNGYKVYDCAASKYKMLRGDAPHGRMLEEKMDGFFSDLVKYHGKILLSRYAASPEREALTLEIERLRNEQRDSDQRAEEAHQNAVAQIKSDLSAMGRSISNATISVMADEDKEVTALREQSVQARDQIEKIRSLLNTILPSDHIDKVESRITQWESMTQEDRNDLLRSLIREVKCVAGPEGELTIFIVENGDNSNPLPPIHTSVRVSGRAWSRSMPDAESWVQEFVLDIPQTEASPEYRSESASPQ